MLEKQQLPERRKSLQAHIREILLAMEPGTSLIYDADNRNCQSLKRAFGALQKPMKDEGLGVWRSIEDAGLFVIVRLK